MAASSSTSSLSRETRTTPSHVGEQDSTPLPNRARHPVSAKADLSNCSKLLRWFFEEHESIDCNLLITNWIMAECLNPAESVQEAYEKGRGILVELIQEGLLDFLPPTKDGDTNKIALSKNSNLSHCHHLGHCKIPNRVPSNYLPGLYQVERVIFTNGVLKDKKGSFILVDGNQLSKFAPSSLKKLKYIVCFNSSSKEDSKKVLKLVSENVNYPSMLLVRGLRLSRIEFSFEKLKTLTVLEMSGILFVDAPESIFSELVQLQYLKFSGLDVKQLPEESFSKLEKLRWLIIRGSPHLKTLPSLGGLNNLEVLNLSYCRSLSELRFDTIRSLKLQVLDLSYTALRSVPQLEIIKKTEYPSRVQELVLSRAYDLKEVDLSQHNDLEFLDLSFTSISSIDSVADMVCLRKLILHSCKSLETLPPLQKLEGLEVLDVSYCKQLTCLPNLCNQRKLRVLDLSETQVNRLPCFPNPSCLQKLSARSLELDSLQTLSSLSSMVELDLRGVKITSSEGFKVDFLGSLESLQTLNLSQSAVADLPAMAHHARLRELLLADCPHLNRLPVLNTLKNLEKLELLAKGNSSSHSKLLLTNSWAVKNEECNAEHLSSSYIFYELPGKLTNLILCAEKALQTATNGDDEAYARQLKTMNMDLKYIKKHMNKFKDTTNSNRASELLRYFTDIGDWSEDDFSKDSDKLQQLLQTIGKLKILLPRTQAESSKSFKTIKGKDETQFFTPNDIVKQFIGSETLQVRTGSLLNSYKSLTMIEKNCLLCFSVFPLHIEEDKNKGVLIGKSLEIKKNMLIYWWVGEGLINTNSVATQVAEKATSANGGKKKRRIEEIGEDILEVLIDKGFIQPVVEKGWETSRCCMNPLVHSFVTEQAKQENYFNFSNKNGKLTPLFKSSNRACLLRSQGHTPSSCEFWAVYVKSPEKLKKFKKVKTLFNVNESIIHIQPEWFSKMKHLSVLYLGNWHSRRNSEHIEVGDQKFMKHLKKMKLLKLLSLQGVSTIAKLPDSVCKLTNLVILDLKDCHNLEELPAEIGSLKNLTHLDISNCHLITKLPKGVSSLSSLETLKGFVIYDHHGDPQFERANTLQSWLKTAKGVMIHEILRCKKTEVCTFGDLLKLERLGDLSIVVNDEMFPDSKELNIFKQMENLRSLKISWGRNLKDKKKTDCCSLIDADQADYEASTEDLANNISADDRKARRPVKGSLDQIEKLALWCFPSETAPKWFVPEEMKNLKKLYIRGGKLEKLPQGPSSNEWNVTTLRLRYLPKLAITWTALKAMFPKMVYLDNHECKNLRFLPCDRQGVWRVEYGFS